MEHIRLGLITFIIVFGILIGVAVIVNNQKKKSSSEENVPDQIEKLSKLRDQGVLTETEFEDEKKKLLSKK